MNFRDRTFFEAIILWYQMMKKLMVQTGWVLHRRIADTDKTRSILGRKLEMTIICLFWYTQEEDILRRVIQLFQTGCFWINFRKLVCHPKQFELKHHQNSYQEHYLCWSIIKRGLVWLSSLWAVLILEDNFWLQKFFYQICWRCLFT